MSDQFYFSARGSMYTITMILTDSGSKYHLGTFHSVKGMDAIVEAISVYKSHGWVAQPCIVEAQEDGKLVAAARMTIEDMEVG